MPVLSHYQIEAVENARDAGKHDCVFTLDLNLTQTRVSFDEQGIHLPERLLSWSEAEEIKSHEKTCFIILPDGIQKTQIYSEQFKRFYSLYPTAKAPTMMVAGFPMHRIKNTDPWTDTMKKIETVGKAHGRVLDTTMGLGYTAIAAARTADQVTTIELDPTVDEICKMNPWSQPLYSRKNITQLFGDTFEVIKTFRDGEFHFVFHDPPTFKLAGELYSSEFYGQLLRVLRRNGKLFHYTGDLESAAGATVAKGAIRRLREAGFRKVDRHPEAFGLVAHR